MTLTTAIPIDQTQRQLLGLLAAMLLLLSGNGLLETTVSYRSSLLSQSASVTSLIMACYYGGFLLGSWHMPSLLHHLSHRTTFVVLAVSLAGSIYALSLYHSPVMVALLQIGCGLCISGLYVVAESFINSRCCDRTRTRYFSYYMLVWYMGVGCGQLPLLSNSGFNSYLFNFAALLVLVSLLPAYFLGSRPASAPLPEDTASSGKALGYRELLWRYPAPIVLSLVSGMMIGILFGMGPAFGEQHFSSSRLTALMIAAFVVGAGLMQLPVARLSERLNREVIVIGLAVLGLITALTALLLSSGGFLSLTASLVLALLLGAGALPLYSLGTSLIQDRVAGRSRITASALMLLVNGFGSIIGPLLAGQMMELWGNRSFYTSLLLCYAIVICLPLWMTSSKQTATTAAAMDP